MPGSLKCRMVENSSGSVLLKDNLDRDSRVFRDFFGQYILFNSNTINHIGVLFSHKVVSAPGLFFLKYDPESAMVLY